MGRLLIWLDQDGCTGQWAANACFRRLVALAAARSVARGIVIDAPAIHKQSHFSAKGKNILC